MRNVQVLAVPFGRLLWAPGAARLDSRSDRCPAARNHREPRRYGAPALGGSFRLVAASSRVRFQPDLGGS